MSTWLVATTHNPLAPGFYLLLAACSALLAAHLGLSRLPAPEPPSRCVS